MARKLPSPPDARQLPAQLERVTGPELSADEWHALAEAEGFDFVDLADLARAELPSWLRAELEAERGELRGALQERIAEAAARRQGRSRGAAAAREAKHVRDAAVDEQLARRARDMKRRNPSLSNAMIGHHMTRDGGARVNVRSADGALIEVVVERIGAKRVARWLASE